MVRSGRFGLYVTDGETNATLRLGDAPETLTMDRASELLAERRNAEPSTRVRAAAKKTTRATKAANATKAPAKKRTTTVKKGAATKKAATAATGAAKRAAAAKGAETNAALAKSARGDG